MKIEWKTVRTGAFFTAILFVIGRYGIGLYLQSSGTESTYGAAGALVLVLLWVYYTAAILYFGAVYTREFAVAMVFLSNRPIMRCMLKKRRENVLLMKFLLKMYPQIKMFHHSHA